MKKPSITIASASIAAFFLASAISPAFAQQILQNAVATDHFGSGVAPNGGKPPVLSSCGTTTAIAAGSNDQAGRLVTGSGATTCTLTFFRAYKSAPACVVSAEVATQPTYTVSTTAITFSVSIASTAYHYSCRGI